MRTIILQRKETSPHGTFGTLTLGEKVFHTGELPWCYNARMVSCIPSCDFDCVWEHSNKFDRKMYELKGVSDGRTEIKFHSANFVGSKADGFKSEVLGCICLGLSRRRTRDGQMAIRESRDAMKEFEAILDKKPFVLSIRDIIFR